MKLLSSFTLAAILTTGAAYAASSYSTTPSATPASATPATTTAAKHHSMSYCEKQAKEKKLTGTEEKTFVKECHSGKKTD